VPPRKPPRARPDRQRRPQRPHPHLQLSAGPAHRPPHQPDAVQAGPGDGRRPGRRDIVATDISSDALSWAAANAERLGLQLVLAQGAWWGAVGDRRFHLAVSNPPYIAAADPHLADLRHEPLLALSPGGDGLEAVRQIVATAPRHLHQRGWLLLEHGWDQGAAVQALLRAAGFEAIATRTDLAGLARCTAGRWCPQGPR
jgi:release factor glutamine methyltransferase